MIDYYPVIKLVHMSCAWLSISGFILRGLWSLQDSPVLRLRAARIIPISVDTLLLASALTLASLSDQWPFEQAWLSAKLSALVVYILLGMVALHWARNRLQTVLGLLAAILTFGYMIAVATTRNPLPFAN